jgi:hypothetical protein
MKRAVKFIPVVVLKNGIIHVDGHMTYTNRHGKWLYVSEDGHTVMLYDNIAYLIRDMYKKDDNDDYVITGWDLSPTRFVDSIDDAYNYYNARFED